MLTSLSRSFWAPGLSVLFAISLGGCGGSTSQEGTGGSGTGGGAGSGAGGGAGTGGSGGGCDYQGGHYLIGQSFPAGDGCNSCFCEGNGQVCCSLLYCEKSCDYGGQLHKPGESYPATDGCNQCTCQADGQSICTKLACAVTCTYAGQTYTIGQQFPALDGCNTCTCTDQGVSCTEKLCPCNPDAEWWRNYVAKDPQQCMLIDYMCVENTKPFSNSCGCGCEQDASCPQYIDCMPPAPNCDELKKKCPYSGVAY